MEHNKENLRIWKKKSGDALRPTITSSEVGETGWSHFLTTLSLMFGFLQARCWRAHIAARMKMLQVGNDTPVGSYRRGVLGALGLHMLVWRLRKVDMYELGGNVEIWVEIGFGVGFFVLF